MPGFSPKLDLEAVTLEAVTTNKFKSSYSVTETAIEIRNLLPGCARSYARDGCTWVLGLCLEHQDPFPGFPTSEDHLPTRQKASLILSEQDGGTWPTVILVCVVQVPRRAAPDEVRHCQLSHLSRSVKAQQSNPFQGPRHWTGP